MRFWTQSANDQLMYHLETSGNMCTSNIKMHSKTGSPKV